MGTQGSVSSYCCLQFFQEFLKIFISRDGYFDTFKSDYWKPFKAAAKNLTPVVLELGGKNPVWIDPRKFLK